MHVPSNKRLTKNGGFVMSLSKLSLSMVRLVGRLAFSVLLLLALVSVAAAYTLVFRDGRRVEIPAQFTLTKMTLTYELAPGFNKTVQVILIDVAATERANHEAAGDFFKHADEQSPNAAPSLPPHARSTITNGELASIERRRLESERAYENRRRELGLPSIEESRRRQREAEAAMLDRARDKADLEARDEAYWRERARSLRNEIAATDAQIDYVRGRLAEVSPSTYGLVLPGSPYYGPYGRRTIPNIRSTGAGVIGNGEIVRQYPNGGISGQDRRRIYNPPYRRGYPNVYGYPNGYPVGPTSQADPEERTNLTPRLDDLMTTRAALNARWLQLEDEARDARVPQIWLEP